MCCVDLHRHTVAHYIKMLMYHIHGRVLTIGLIFILIIMTSPSWHLYVIFYVYEWEVMVEPPQTGLFGR